MQNYDGCRLIIVIGLAQLLQSDHYRYRCCMALNMVLSTNTVVETVELFLTNSLLESDFDARRGY